jgi:Leucine-rich repeat (LRR) protein
MELFVKDVEEPLDDERRVGLADRVPLFLLTKCPSDRLALEALFKSTGGANWTNKTGWMTDAELGDWHGVEVDEEGRVTELDLEENGLAGPLPSDMQQLSALQNLFLNENQLTGPIPAELGQLGALVGLALSTNQLSGPIPPELGQLGALQVLGLNGNQLSGPIPAELGQMGAVTQLFLSFNQLSGPIAAELGQIGALTHLYLDYNPQLTGQEAFQGHMQAHHPDCELTL